MSETRLNVRIEGVMAEHVNGLIEQKLYNNQSEYIRDLIRHDMADYSAEQTRQSVMQGYKDLGEGKYKEFTNIKDAVNYGREVREQRTSE